MKKKNPLKKQVGGNHYKKDFVIQPVEFIEKNEIGFALGNVIKYLLRDKDDRVQDLLKAKHLQERQMEQNHQKQRILKNSS